MMYVAPVIDFEEYKLRKKHKRLINACLIFGAGLGIGFIGGVWAEMDRVERLAELAKNT
jgi:hypothetical protein